MRQPQGCINNVLWSIAWNTFDDFLKRRNKIDAQVQPFPVVVD
ncbi:MAG: hypothetical protein UW86_C0010G0019, partial [Microgenomates group bacterium GW2011_GWA1_Microgenomates_45_10]